MFIFNSSISYHCSCLFSADAAYDFILSRIQIHETVDVSNATSNLIIELLMEHIVVLSECFGNRKENPHGRHGINAGHQTRHSKTRSNEEIVIEPGEDFIIKIPSLLMCPLVSIFFCGI